MVILIGVVGRWVKQDGKGVWWWCVCVGGC